MSDATGVPCFNLVDLFAGVGGFSLGFMDRSTEPSCRFVPKLMVDIDKEAKTTAMRNLPKIPYLVADVNRLSAPDILKAAKLQNEEKVHVLIGGPPCQGFSFLGKRALEDERNILVVDFLRMVKELKPLVAVIENVPLMITSHDGAIIKEVCQTLSDLGYASAADILSANEYGVPQFRRRAFILAYHHSLSLAPQFPTRTHERIKINGEGLVPGMRYEPDRLAYITVEQAISDLPALRAGEGEEVMFYPGPPLTDFQAWARSGSVAIFNHKSRLHTKAFLEKISIIKEGEGNDSLPDDQKFSDNYYSQAYARLHRNGIATTITTCFPNPGSGRFTHYRDLRALTVREAARLQSFPDAYAFEGIIASQARHVGNAVPPLLARAIRNRIAQDLISAGAHEDRGPGRPKELRQETYDQCSRMMRAVARPSQKDIYIELKLRKALWSVGIKGFRVHSDELPGKPDVVLPTHKIAIFVDGCFWHGCPNCYREPRTQTKYWSMKVQRNRERDQRVTDECVQLGWNVFRVWEHDIKNGPEAVAEKIKTLIRGRSKPLSRNRKGQGGNPH